MFTVMSTTKLVSLNIDNERFESVMTISKTQEREQHRDAENEKSTKMLHLLQAIGSARLSAKNIYKLVDYCRWLRELSLSYSSLSDKLLLALCSMKQLHLETLRIEAHPEAKPLPCISGEAWSAFLDRLPNINLILLSYMIDEDDQKLLLTSHVPVTHLYLGDTSAESTISQISEQCPRLIELVIAACASGPIDRFLISMAKNCTRLSVVGLGDCEITHVTFICSGLTQFVTLCARRLQVLYVAETSLIEDADSNIFVMSAKISSLLDRTWVPEFVPLW